MTYQKLITAYEKEMQVNANYDYNLLIFDCLEIIHIVCVTFKETEKKIDQSWEFYNSISRAVIKFLISRNLCVYTCNNLQVSWEYNVQMVTSNTRNIHWAQLLQVTALNDNPDK